MGTEEEHGRPRLLNSQRRPRNSSVVSCIPLGLDGLLAHVNSTDNSTGELCPQCTPCSDDETMPALMDSSDSEPESDNSRDDYRDEDDDKSNQPALVERLLEAASQAERFYNIQAPDKFRVSFIRNVF